MNDAHDGQDDKKTKTSRLYVKKFFLGPRLRRVVLDYIAFRLTISVLYAKVFFFSTSFPPPLLWRIFYIV